MTTLERLLQLRNEHYTRLRRDAPFAAESQIDEAALLAAIADLFDERAPDPDQ